jgi:hypothetical protein
MKRIGILLFLFAVLGAGPAFADTATLEATMILASNERAAMDRRLEKVEFQLRRMFKFEYYKHFGEGQAIVNMPGQASIDLGHESRLDIRATGRDGKVRAEVTWIKGGQSVLNTTVSLKRGAQVILGGVPHDGGTLIVTLSAK